MLVGVDIGPAIMAPAMYTVRSDISEDLDIVPLFTMHLRIVPDLLDLVQAVCTIPQDLVPADLLDIVPVALTTAGLVQAVEGPSAAVAPVVAVADLEAAALEVEDVDNSLFYS